MLWDGKLLVYIPSLFFAGFQYGLYPGIIITDYAIAKETFVEKADIYSDRTDHLDLYRMTNKMRETDKKLIKLQLQSYLASSSYHQSYIGLQHVISSVINLIHVRVCIKNKFNDEYSYYLTSIYFSRKKKLFFPHSSSDFYFHWFVFSQKDISLSI